jgi:hypothetical protein
MSYTEEQMNRWKDIAYETAIPNNTPDDSLKGTGLELSSVERHRPTYDTFPDMTTAIKTRRLTLFLEGSNNFGDLRHTWERIRDVFENCTFIGLSRQDNGCIIMAQKSPSQIYIKRIFDRIQKILDGQYVVKLMDALDERLVKDMTWIFTEGEYGRRGSKKTDIPVMKSTFESDSSADVVEGVIHDLFYKKMSVLDRTFIALSLRNDYRKFMSNIIEAAAEDGVELNASDFTEECMEVGSERWNEYVNYLD